MNLGESKPIFYFKSHGEVNTDKTLELARRRAEKLGINKIVIASETGLSALKASNYFQDKKLIVVSSAAGTSIPDTSIGNLKIGLPDLEIVKNLTEKGVKIIRGTDPFWNISAHIDLIDTPKLGMMFYNIICSGIHVCITAVLEATDAGYLSEGEEVIVIAGSWIGLDTAIVAKASNSVNFFKRFEIPEIICKPRKARYEWPVEQKDWKGDLKKYKKFIEKTE